MRDTFEDDYVELVFEFEVTWIFEAVHIYTNNYFSRDVQVTFFSFFFLMVFIPPEL